jgi:hypothetical protein
VDEVTEWKKVNERIDRDRWGRYLLPDPDTGEKLSWTRATTIASALKDRYGLEQWKLRNVVWAIGQRPDLYARAAAALKDDDRTLSEVVEKAEEAAALDASATMGSAIHQFTEHLDAGRDIPIPAEFKPDLDAYQKTMREHGVKVVDGMIERVVGLPGPRVAGTFDRLVTVPGFGLPLIADIKTPTDKRDKRTGDMYNSLLRYSLPDISLQLGIYANADVMWAGADGWQPMPGVDPEWALIIHVPAGQGECRLYLVDIEKGWRAVQLALDVREWRANGHNLARELPRQGSTDRTPPKGGEAAAPGLGAGASAVDPPAPAAASSIPTAPRAEWLRKRVEAIKAHPEARAQLAAIWKGSFSHIPTFPKGGPASMEDIDSIAGVCAMVEMEWSMSFPDEDPADELAGDKDE